MKRVVCAIFAAMVSLGAVASTSILIAEENFEGAMSCRLASVGSFPVAPGIKSGMGVGGSCAYGFGRSSCNANAWDGYVNDLVFTFSKRYVITKVEFWEMERYDNWGSQGWLMADGIQIENTTFARLPTNDRIADSTFRKREFVLSNVISDGLTFRCWDITNLSELFIDNIKIYGYAYDGADIDLQASSNLDDSIKLSWNVSLGLSGARYYIDRRGSESEVFQCLNKDNPTRDRHYSDRDCLPGVNYYYRVWSESGIESEQKIGKRVAKTTRPKFGFVLTGSEHPENKGSAGEENVLVAGKTITCIVYTMNTTQPMPIKRVELIGTPIGGPANRKHKVLWIARSAVLENVNFSSYGNHYGTFDNVVLLPEGCVMQPMSIGTKLTATLKCGAGLHGAYQWEVQCEFADPLLVDFIGNGTWSAETTFRKNVYFDKYGTDNGGSPEAYWDPNKRNDNNTFGGYVVSRFYEKLPNWYAYWREDGACPGLADKKVVRYRGMRGNNMVYGGESGFAVETDSERRVIRNDPVRNWPTYVNIDADAVDFWMKGPIIRIDNASWNEDQKNFGTRKADNGNVYRAFGIYNVEDIVAHEIQHNITKKHYKEQEKTPDFRDSDLDARKCASEIAANGICQGRGVEFERSHGDSIADIDEDNNYFGITYFDGVNLGIYSDEVDTYDLYHAKGWSYGGYGDNELVSMFAGRKGMKNANPDNDWAYPGEKSGGFPVETCNVTPEVTTRAKPMRSNTRARLMASPSGDEVSTNLVISITGISTNAQRDQNCVTGIVYTIGTSIQGEDLVDFNGYLIDAQSNVVATAISAASAESESVELFFDARNIFDNYNGGSLTLGSVDLTVDGNYSTNNVIGTLYDFAVEPIVIDKSELLCNKGYILNGATTNDVSASGIAVSIPVLVNVAGDYRLEAELVSTNDELVAMAFATNYCATGTNVFELTFTSDAIYQNGRSGIQAVRNVQLWCGDEMIDANATAFEFADSYDSADFVPSGISIVVDSSSGRFVEPTATPDGKMSSVRFVFDVTNATETMVGYDVASVLMNTNSEIVASIRTAVAVTNGLNQIEITIPASTISKSGVNGPYRFESIELLPQSESSCGTTYRPSVLSAAYMASDFGTSAIEPCGTPRLVDPPDCARLVVEYSYEALRVGRVIAEVVLADRNGDFAARVVTTNDFTAIGVKTNNISIASDDVVGGVTNSPYSVGCLSLTPDIIGESSVYMDTESLTNIFWQVAAPVFSPATKTVFFKREQTVSISCATPAAAIRYTLDGSEPTASSKIYDGSFVITNSVTVKAKAFVEGLSPSETVQAEYVRASIVGDNLVQETAPAHGVAQSVSVPVPGTYQVSFDWAQGGAFELRLSKGGDVRTIAAISAENAGTTNLLFGIPTIGDYELMVYDPSSGATQPAVVSNLSLSIPDTPENKGRYWIYETENTYGSTGEWIAESGFVNGKMPIKGSNIFNPYTSSTGDHVVITVTLEFGALMPPGYLDEEMSDCKARIAMAQEESGENVFKVFTSEHGENVWKSVYAEGLGAPTLGTPYTVKFTFDYTNGAYTVTLVTNETEIPLTDGTTGTFAIANSHDSVVKTVEFVGDSEGGFGNFISLLGSYGDSASRFAEGDTLNLSGGAAAPPLTDRQAEWLNSMGVYDALKAKIGRMGMEDFMVAYLLNLDLTKDGAGLVTFKVSEIDVGETDVTIKVRLDRAGTMQTSDAGDVRDAPINGILKLYGGNSPTERVLLNATEVTDANFGDGDTATFTYPRSGGAKFFRPVIEVPSN